MVELGKLGPCCHDCGRAEHGPCSPEALLREIRDLLRDRLPGRGEDPLPSLGRAQNARIAQQESHIARLREELDDWKDAASRAETPPHNEEHCSCVGPLQKTIEGLREEVERQKALFPEKTKLVTKVIADRDALAAKLAGVEAERDRMREALRAAPDVHSVADCDYDDWWDRHRNPALAGQPAQESTDDLLRRMRSMADRIPSSYIAQDIIRVVDQHLPSPDAPDAEVEKCGIAHCGQPCPLPRGHTGPHAAFSPEVEP